MKRIQHFFPTNSALLALPNWQNPRLYIQAGDARSRWRSSHLYPAFRQRAKVYRLGLRTQAALGLMTARQTAHDEWALETFTKDVLPALSQTAVLLGTAGPAQKITAQLWVDGQVAGYLKYAEKPAARRRLAQEHRVLTRLPPGYGPEVLKYGGFLEGDALLTRALVGQQLAVTRSPDSITQKLLARLELDTPRGVGKHPWCRLMRERYGAATEPWIEALALQRWPVVAHHGDFAPWNILQLATGGYCLIDWEYGDVCGFPHLDHVYYVLQVAALISQWSPERARAFAVADLDMADGQAQALVSLTAFHAYQQALEDGHPADASLMRWRRAIWEAA